MANVRIERGIVQNGTPSYVQPGKAPRKKVPLDYVDRSNVRAVFGSIASAGVRKGLWGAGSASYDSRGIGVCRELKVLNEQAYPAKHANYVKTFEAMMSETV